jgi:hypothetical protein
VATGDARRVEDDAARGVDRDVTFATAAAEWLRYVEHDRVVKPSNAVFILLDRNRSTKPARSLMPALLAIVLPDRPAPASGWS